MTFVRSAIIFCFLLFHYPLSAQVSDTSGHTDTLFKTHFNSPDTLVVDIASIQQADSIRIKKLQALQDSLANVKSSRHTGYLINGKVADMNTGEGVPFATINFPDVAVMEST